MPIGGEYTVKQPALEKCLGCARAASTYPQSTFAEIATQYRSNPEFRAAFEQCKQNMVKGSVTSYIKPFREQEVSKAVIYGRRLESAFDFISLQNFTAAFGADAKEVVPDQVVKVKQHDGCEVEGLAIRPDILNVSCCEDVFCRAIHCSCCFRSQFVTIQQ